MNDNFHARMILSTAVFAAVAALLVGPASAYVMDVEGGGGSGTSVTAQPAVEPGTIPYLSHGIGVDLAQLSGTVEPKAQASAAPGAIPYLSHGIGVDQSLFQGEQQQSLGLTGDSPITRVVGQEPAGTTDDFVLRRSGSGTTQVQSYTADGASLDTRTDVNWTWVGFGAGMAALLAAAMGALYLSARNRDRVALP